MHSQRDRKQLILEGPIQHSYKSEGVKSYAVNFSQEQSKQMQHTSNHHDLWRLI